MRRIAIFGASSQMARDLIPWLATKPDTELDLYSRDMNRMAAWLQTAGITARAESRTYASFGERKGYSAILNFVGIGDPAKALSMGADILDVTYRFDSLAVDYLRSQPDCRYFFASSGAAYGAAFEAPVAEHSAAIFPVNGLTSRDWYGLAKFYAECRHRSLSDLAIIDFRVFSYVSRNLDLSARFLVTDAVRAIHDGEVLRTSPDPAIRDYLHSSDLCALIGRLLEHEPRNDVIDCYSKAPVDKVEMLQALEEKFGLRFEVESTVARVDATGRKPCYYSLNRRARQYGYAPTMTSLEGILDAAGSLLSTAA